MKELTHDLSYQSHLSITFLVILMILKMYQVLMNLLYILSYQFDSCD